MSATQTIEQVKAERAALEAQIKALMAQQAELKKEVQKTFSLKVSEAGCVSVYGFGRFPTSLYPDQMTKLLDHADEIRAFMVTNKAQLDAIALAKSKVKNIK